MGSASLAVARLPPARNVTIPLQPEGLRGKKSEGTHLNWDIIGEGDSKSVYKESKTLLNP